MEKQLEKDTLKLLTRSFDDLHTCLQLIDMYGQGSKRQLETLRDSLNNVYAKSRTLLTKKSNRTNIQGKVVH
ncbi:hypothetical protein [Piscirickettsia litoralis]|uniref:Uncharacterized protein n=1 Tax=Piscirickettsia litoralis TaxID=1891921 RepID=A0ABX2ZWV8_9GAMM|nr:hypothetical protein [Piscirickettsia litoralis]ODN41116.1 hypothetical protein BGC07_17735 [Piscirickettsia litoralis]